MNIDKILFLEARRWHYFRLQKELIGKIATNEFARMVSEILQDRNKRLTE